MISLIFMAEQATKHRKSSIKLAAQRSANRRQNKDYINKDIYKSLSIPMTRTAAQKSANRRQTIYLSKLHTIEDLNIYLYYVSRLIYKEMFSAELKKFTSYSKMVKAIQNALPTTIYLTI